MIGLYGSSCSGAAGIVDVRNFRIEEPSQEAHQPALGLPFSPRNNRSWPANRAMFTSGMTVSWVADDAGEQLVAAAEHAEEVVVRTGA